MLSMVKYGWFICVFHNLTLLSLLLLKVLVNDVLKCNLIYCSNFCTFRNVWPLELLAYIASCHALNLNNKTLIEELNYTQNIMDRSTVLKRTKWDHTKSVEYETNNISNARDIHVSSDIEKDTIQKEEQILQRGGQNFNLSHPFRRHIKPKKQYEIDILSKVCKNVCIQLIYASRFFPRFETICNYIQKSFCNFILC